MQYQNTKESEKNYIYIEFISCFTQATYINNINNNTYLNMIDHILSACRNKKGYFVYIYICKQRRNCF